MSTTALTSAAFLTCTPIPVTVSNTVTEVVTSVYTVTYSRILLAACPTSEWLATYTLTEVCTGDVAIWTTPAIPPNFVVTTIGCNVCAQPSVAITCPVELASQTGQMTIQGNGVTASGMAPMGAAAAAAPTPAGHAGHDMAAAPAGASGAQAPYVTAGAPVITLKESLAILVPGALALFAAVQL